MNFLSTLTKKNLLSLFLLSLLLVGLFSLLPVAHADGFSTAKSLFVESDEDTSFLPVEKAFQVELKSSGAQTAQASFSVEPGYYLYQQRIKITVPDTSQGKVLAVNLPVGEEKDDPNFGKQTVYHHDFKVDVQFADAKQATVKVVYQGCSEKGLCYPPQTKLIPIAFDADAASRASETSTQSTENDDSAALLHSGVWWKIVLGFFGAGLLLAFTPCVFPMVPILSGIIVGKNAHTSKMKAFTLSLAYVLGMCVTYTLAGVAAGLSGQLLSNALQTPLALTLGALVFVVLSLSMFGFYELKLPSSIEHFFFNWSNRLKGGHLISDFVMGAISALIISPCVAAPLAGALLYISKTQDVVLGGVALFSLSLGMGAPLLLIGASAGTLLPKAGAWMNAVRELFGVLMLAVAVWVISPILPTAITMGLWAALCIVPAIYMRAIDPLPSDASTTTRLFKGLAVLLLGVGLAILVGALSGATSPLRPLQGLQAPTAQHSAPAFKRVANLQALQNEVASANGKVVMFDFYADWCVSCKEFEQFVLTDLRVQAKLSNMVLLQADVTQNNADDAALLKHFELFGPPGIVFFDAQGQMISEKIVGYKNADAFLAFLAKVTIG